VPDALDIQMLHRNSDLSDPTGKDFDYTKGFKSLDLDALIQDLHARGGPFRAYLALSVRRPLVLPHECSADLERAAP
jgi:hypothetical protein